MDMRTTVDGKSRRHTGVIVTGSHRSGTTWVGRVLGAASELHYVQEPFNIVARQQWLDPRPPRQFFRVDETNEDDWARPVEQMLDLHYPLVPNLRRARSTSAVRRSLRVALDAREARRRGRAPLVKDPIALFSTPWLASRFEIVPVVLVREAVSFVGSLKERGWTFDFRHWADQPNLMAGPLANHRDRIDEMIAADTRGDGSQPDVVDQGIVEWNAMYDFVDRMRRDHPEFIVVSYERLARDPEVEFPRLFERVGVGYGDAQSRQVEQMSTGSRTGRSAIDVKRDSRAAVDTWRERLSDAEVDRITAATAEVASRFDDL